MLTALLKYWKEGIIILAFIVCGLFVSDVALAKRDLSLAKIRIAQLETEREALVQRLDTLAILSKEQITKLEEADTQRIKILGDLSKNINSLRRQQIPKDCSSAVEFAIKNKEDLSWPK